MNCQDFWNTMPELEPLDDRAGQHLGHLRECGACAALWKRQHALTAGLRTVAAEWSQLQAPASIESRLTAAFRDRARPQPTALRTVPRSHFWVPAIAWAGAAAALVVLAMFIVNGRQPQMPARSAPGVLAMAAAQAPSDFEPFAGDSLYSSDDFIPLPNAARIAPDEDVNLVRVEVPRWAMIELGLEVSPEHASEPVEAEVMLGSDGLARAVRFLD